MATIYLRNVDAKMYRRLRDRAKKSRRSITQEAISILQDSLPAAKPSNVFKRIGLMRDEVQRRYGSFGDSASLIREDRNR